MPLSKTADFSEIQQLIYEIKIWGAAGDEISWQLLKAAPLPQCYFSRIPLLLDKMDEKVCLDLYYKPSILEGLPPAFTASLVMGGTRILAVDSGLAAMHLNKVGQGEEFYAQSFAHPHLHRATETALQGYAEPLPASDIEDLWEDFLLLANILEAPPLNFPDAQQGRLPL
ncbi:hypothetical protein SAMN05660443_0742 [Marinospirillum celere]|uniref:Uncharacterized protein n=1 Tax=Marinospirillum celere TaxID=1122252 RepID=A0A1I1ENV3_9GAMM|nr:hypothetical protein [Marinospirillum celere]SFB88784.1 hypothetical protein SAMN05660443_0742 [Marinospirillum celere]